MVFLNLLLAGGLLAVSAPIIIHLLHRSKVMPYDWGAMMFLEELMAERARRLRMQEILLLIVRALIVACLAFALMRPAIKSPTAGVRSADTHTSAVVLLDDSYSMNTGHNRKAWQDACDAAIKYIGTLQSGDDVSVMFTSSAGKVPPPAALYDHERAREIIRKATPQYDKTDIPRALSAALQQLDSQHNPRRELVLFTDMQASGWELADGARWSFIAGTVRSARVRPNIILAATPELKPNNLALLKIEPSRQVVDSFTPVTFNVTVANESPEAMRDATVTFIVDNVAKATRSVKLDPGGREVVAFEHKFERPGSHYVACRARSSQDMLEDDNELNHSVVVIDRLPVLLVDGDKKDRPLGSETDFLRLALSPRDRDDPNWRTVIDTTVIDSTDLRYTDLSKFRVVVLANVAALPAAAVSEIERFVVAGGGLMIALGNNIRPDAYNRDLFRQGAGLLPVALKRIEGATLQNESSGAVRLVAAGSSAPKPAQQGPDPVHLASIVSNAPALDLFRPEKGQDWSRARVRSYFSVAAPGDGVRALAAFSNGDPVLLQKRLGEGRVLLFTSAIDMDWSDLPIHPFYVPLMQNLVFDLASAVIPPRNVPVGQTIAYVATGPNALKPHILIPPGGEPITLKTQRQGQLSIFTHENTKTPGLYSIAPEGAPPDERVFYTVTADRSDSVLDRLEREDTEKLERDLGAHIASDWSAMARLLMLDAGSFEISKYLLMAAIVFCFVEIWLTRRWA
ncbi:MAG TPA: BatA domain-containing protein [Planctomycetota bacterium]|nr:BatA domain-containing protein [Planctomycetota bacterium]